MFRRDKATKTALDRLQERMETVTAKLADLESAQRKLELEWIETYDKVRHQLSRMAKRGTLPDTKGGGPNAAPEASETEHMDPISARIHARRNRGFLKPPNAEK